MTLSLPRTGLVGSTIPIAVKLRNLSKHPVWIVGVLDGSEAGIRYPQFLPQVSVGEKIFPSSIAAECGMVAPLHLRDFRMLSAGESFDPTLPVAGASYLTIDTFMRFRPPFPGRFEFSLTFSSESPDLDAWLGVLEYPGHEAVRARLLEVPRMRLTATANVQVVE